MDEAVALLRTVARRHTREVGLGAIWVLLLLLFGILSPEFRHPSTFLDQSRFWVEIGILSAAMFGVVLVGGIDLSVGSVLALSGLVVVRLHAEYGFGIWPAAAVGLLLGVTAGLLNGLLVTLGRIPDLVATLATLVIFRGLAQLVAQNRVHSNLPEDFQWLGTGTLFAFLPAQWLVLLAFWSLVFLLLHRTPLGRYAAASGANAPAASIAGVPVRGIRVVLYALSGWAAAVSALVYTARYNTARSDDGTGIELDVVTCVFLGGATLSGGSGSLAGVLLAVMIVGSLRTGLILLGVPENFRRILFGSILLGAVAVNEMLRRRAGRA